MIDLNTAKLEAEELLLRINKAAALNGKRGYKKALEEVKRQAMICRKNLQDLRVAIIEEVKTSN